LLAVSTKRPLRLILPAALVASALMLVPSPAGAHTFEKSDKNDTKGLLDLESISVTHDDGNLVYSLKTFKSWHPIWLSGQSYFLVAIDKNQDGTFDRCAFIIWYAGDLVGPLTNCGSHFIEYVPLSKSGRTATITIDEGIVGGTHDWAAFTFYAEKKPCLHGCLDSVPNKHPLLHDLKEPEPYWVTSLTGQLYSTQLSLTNVVPVEFVAEDADTGVASWEIQRLIGNVWEPFTSGPASGELSEDIAVNLDLDEGQTYALRIGATDKQENFGYYGPWITMHVPFDDSNPGAAYSSGWTTTSSDPDFFQGTSHVSAMAGATMTLTFSGRYFHVFGGPADGTATLSTDSGDEFLTETTLTAKGEILGGGAWATEGPHTITITVTGGTFVLDGIGVQAY
jgi:hypothetical protein